VLSDLGHFVIEAPKLVFQVVVWNLILFNLGRLVLLACTVGQYPRGRSLESDHNRICLTGVAVVLIVWIGIAARNHFVGAVA